MAESINPAKTLGGGRLKPIKPDSDLTALVYGKMLPQAVPIEEIVLGSLLIDKDAFSVVVEVLRPVSFYKPAHGMIFEAMLHLFEKSQPIDIVTVYEALNKTGQLESIGGIGYLVDLSNKVSSAANLEYHARIIAQKFIQRELIRVSTTVINDSFEDTKDVFDLLDDAESSLFDITQQNLNRSYEQLGSLAVEAQKQIEVVSKREGGLLGVPSGFNELDKITSGWQNSDLIIVAARPGMGKTAFTLAMARNAAVDHRRPVEGTTHRSAEGAVGAPDDRSRARGLDVGHGRRIRRTLGARPLRRLGLPGARVPQSGGRAVRLRRAIGLRGPRAAGQRRSPGRG